MGALPANFYTIKPFIFNALKSSEPNNLYHYLVILASHMTETKLKEQDNSFNGP